MIVGDVTVNLTGLRILKRSVQAEVMSGQAGPLNDVVKKWAIRYRSFVQRRFDKYSRGGGDWPSLSPSTIAGRRRGTGQGGPSILRDTGTLFAALTPLWDSPPGGINQIIPGGVRVGFGGTGAHPTGLTTVAEIANFHQEGSGRLPKREIIVDPTRDVLDACARDLEKALRR